MQRTTKVFAGGGRVDGGGVHTREQRDKNLGKRVRHKTGRSPLQRRNAGGFLMGCPGSSPQIRLVILPVVEALLRVHQLLPPRRLQQGGDGVLEAERRGKVQQGLAPVVLHRYLVVVLQQQLERAA